jgi:hypothetical protein
MKGYIIISIGNCVEDDYICATGFDDDGFDDDVRKIFINKATAEKFCKNLQRLYDLDQPDNPYEFRLEEVEIIED